VAESPLQLTPSYKPSAPSLDVEKSIEEAVSAWIGAFRSRNTTQLAESYAPTVEKYFRKENISREQVQQFIQSDFASVADIRTYTVDDIKVEGLPTDSELEHGVAPSRATATFHKAWETTQVNGKTFSGEEIERLTFSKSDEGWKIVREEELNIIRASRR
jgi:ketosteroid isomerase-like protein